MVVQELTSRYLLVLELLTGLASFWVTLLLSRGWREV